MENPNPIFYSTIQHPSDYEMQMIGSQPPLKKKLSRGSSYAERRNQNKLNYNYEEQRRQEEMRVRYHERNRENEEYRNEDFNTHPVIRENEQVGEYENDEEYLQQDNEQMDPNEGEELNIGQNVFYDNASKSNSPTKKPVPKLLNQNSKQLSFSNMTSDNNLSKKKQKARNNIHENKPKSMMRLASDEDQIMKGVSRMGKNLTKGKLKQIMMNPDTGKPLRKRNSKAGKKKVGTDMYKQVPTKRRAKKMNYPQEDSFMNKSYKNNPKNPKYMMNAKKKLVTMADRKMFNKGSPQKNEEDKHFNNYSSKLPRTSNLNSIVNI
jgi:hypothetical protein